VVGGMNVLVEREQQLFEAGRIQETVVDDENSPPRQRSALRLTFLFGLAGDDLRSRGPRDSDGKLTSLARAVALHTHAALVHLDQRADNRQTDAQPAPRSR